MIGCNFLSASLSPAITLVHCVCVFTHQPTTHDHHTLQKRAVGCMNEGVSLAAFRSKGRVGIVLATTFTLATFFFATPRHSLFLFTGKGLLVMRKRWRIHPLFSFSPPDYHYTILPTTAKPYTPLDSPAKQMM